MNLPFISNVPLYSGAGHIFPFSYTIRDQFTFKSRFGDEVALYKAIGDRIMVPRNCAVYGESKMTEGQDIEVVSKFVPRNEDQEKLAERSTMLLQKGDSHILQAHTGFGKTIIGAEIGGRVGKKFLVIVPKDDIVMQWYKAFEIVFGWGPKEIGVIQGDVCDVAGKKVVIGMIHSVCKDKRYPSWVYNDFGLVIVDECHIVSARTFSNAMWLFPARLRLGLSATPYRQDGKDFVFHAHIGPIRIQSQHLQLVPKVIVKKSNYLIPTKKQWVTINGKPQYVDVKMVATSGKTGALTKAIAGSIPRNKLIADFVYQAYKKGRNTIVFSDLRDGHLSQIETELIGLGIGQHAIGWYVGGMSEAERDKAKAKPIILSTYKMTAMATDIPWLDTCVLATPRSDVVQIVGRILREYPDKKQPVVFDVVDTDSKVLLSYYKKRRNWYLSIGAQVIEKN